MPGKWSPRLASCSTLASCSIAYRSRSASTKAQVLKGDDLGPTQVAAHQTFRLRKDGNAKPLPLPPTLDPVVIEQKSQFRTTKAQPNFADLTPFQKRLYANPYAHALASPVRVCRATSVQLPVDLLATLHARPHPETSDPWLLPVSLTTDKKHLGLPFQFINRNLVATQLGIKKAWRQGLYMRMVDRLGFGNTKKLVWREDMPDLILKLMQKQVVKKLSWNLGFRGRLIPVASPRSEDIDSLDDVSCVLYVKSLRTRADDVHDRANEIMSEMNKWSAYVAKSFKDKLDPHASPDVTHHAPEWYAGPLVPRLQPRLEFPELEFKTTTWRGRKVAVYSMTDLLGEDIVRQLMQESKYEGKSCLIMKQARHNVPVELLLMQLQAYIAQPGP